MKYIVFSDVHGNNHAFLEFLDHLERHAGDYIPLFLGDFVGYYYGPNEIIDYCREKNVLCLLGNHDQYFLDVLDGKRCLQTHVKKYGLSYEIALNTISDINVRFLRNLSSKMLLSAHGIRALFCHGSPHNHLEGRIYPDTDLSIFDNEIEELDFVVTGHTHHKMNRRYRSTIFLNPGSLGQQRDGTGCSYMLLDVLRGCYSFHSVSYPIAKLEKEVDIFDPGRNDIKSVLRRST